MNFTERCYTPPDTPTYFAEMSGARLWFDDAEQVGVAQEIMAYALGSENPIAMELLWLRFTDTLANGGLQLTGEAARQVHFRIGEAATGCLTGRYGYPKVVPAQLAEAARQLWSPATVPSPPATWAEWLALPANQDIASYNGSDAGTTRGRNRTLGLRRAFAWAHLHTRHA